MMMVLGILTNLFGLAVIITIIVVGEYKIAKRNKELEKERDDIWK